MDRFEYSKGGRWLYTDAEAYLWHGGCYVRLVYRPGTLAADILAFRKDLPEYGRSLLIDGDDVTHIDHEELREPDEPEDDSEDVSEEMSRLPVVKADEKVHYLKHCMYRSEIQNLLKVRGGPSVIELLGRTEDMRLVFPRYTTDLFEYVVRHRGTDFRQHATWLLQIISGLKWLHSHGVVHRDLVLRNIMYSEPVVIADLESKHTSLDCRPPEVSADAGFSPASDVYALGFCVWQMEKRNYPRPFAPVELEGPLAEIFHACRRERPEDRPTLEELTLTLESLSDPQVRRPSSAARMSEAPSPGSGPATMTESLSEFIRTKGACMRQEELALAVLNEAEGRKVSLDPDRILVHYEPSCTADFRVTRLELKDTSEADTDFAKVLRALYGIVKDYEGEPYCNYQLCVHSLCFESHTLDEWRTQLPQFIGEGIDYKVYKTREGIAVKVAKERWVVAIAVREGLTIKQLSRVPHIVRMYEFHVVDDRIKGLLLQYYPNGTLEDHPRMHECVDRWVLQLAMAIEGMHALGIAHGDLRPDNIMVDEDMDAVVCDFSAAGVGNECRGHPRWSMHETREDDAIIRTEHDVYSYGLLVLYLTSGSKPYPDIDSDDEEALVRATKVPPGFDTSSKYGWLINECLGLRFPGVAKIRETVEKPE